MGKALWLALTLAGWPLWGAECESLAKVALPQAEIGVAELRPAGQFVAPDGRKMTVRASFCRVAGTMRPSADSDIRFEVWMPRDGWNGKFLGIGNGGYAGTIGYGGLADAVERGYATACTDTGHSVAAGITAEWALGHREKVIDFGYRAIHETAVKAKALVAAYYGTSARKSYFNSCSNGGRQALMEAQRFPGDYDGIVAGAPANDWTHLMAAGMWEMKGLLGEPGSYVPAAKLKAIQEAVLQACDAADGVRDNLLQDPRKCKFELKSLVCAGGQESDACLTAQQAAALQRLYDGPHDAQGRSIFPGYSAGGEAVAGGWGPWLTGAEPQKASIFQFGNQFFRNIVYEKADWDWRSFDLTRDLQAAEEKAAPLLNSTNADLSEFRKRGGKLILYHGWSDAAIPAVNSILYFDRVRAKMGASTADEFVRLFMVPGMQHCGGGLGPNYFGQGVLAHGDREHDIESALEAWVEQGAAPASIIATKYNKDNDAASGVVSARPLCPYPQVARWDGRGNTNEAASFRCSAP